MHENVRPWQNTAHVIKHLKYKAKFQIDSCG